MFQTILSIPLSCLSGRIFGAVPEQGAAYINTAMAVPANSQAGFSFMKPKNVGTFVNRSAATDTHLERRACFRDVGAKLRHVRIEESATQLTIGWSGGQSTTTHIPSEARENTVPAPKP